MGAGTGYRATSAVPRSRRRRPAGRSGMKILAIRGRNLASLAGDFEVDFTAEPLASAGVFAITGPTGAGKSTLLDALALALFHDTPRLKAASESGVHLPDGEDGKISPKDGRNILRRGTGEGFAEVDYIGLDGQRWRARWEARRARGKPNGKLQQPAASLENLDTQRQHGGRLLDTRGAIVKTTGLSYDQFCRSILLAQNEFAAFLRASGPDRAELLEALTGTEIYRSISQQCHKRTAEEKRKVEELKTLLGMNPPLAEAERAALEQQLEEARIKEQELRASEQTLQQEANWHARGSDLLQQQTRLQTELETSEAQRDARAEDAARVRRMEAIDAARPLHRDLEKANAALSQHEQARQGIVAAVAKTDAEQRRAQANAAKAREQRDAAEASRQAQAPNIRRARELDQQIGRLTEQHADHSQRSDATARKLQLADQQHKESTTVVSDNQKLISAWSDWQAKNPAFPTEAGPWRQAGPALKDAIRANEQASQAGKSLQELASQTAQDEARIKNLEIALAAARERLQAAREHRTQTERQEQSFDANTLEKDRERLVNRHRLLERLETRVSERNRADEAAAAVQQKVNTLQREQSDRSRSLQELANAIPATSQVAEQARKAWTSSSAIADQHSAALRHQLVEGEPCPVCGSREHPGHAQDDDDIARLVAELASQLATAEAALKALENEQTALKAAFDQAERQQQAEEAELAKRKSALEEATRNLQQALSDLELNPDLSSEQLAATVATQRSELDTDLAALEQQRAELDTARQKSSQAREAADKAESALQAAESSLTEARATAAPTLEARNKAAHQLETRETEAQQAKQAVTVALNLDAGVNADRLGQLAEQWQSGELLREAAAQAETRQPLLLKQLADLQKQSETLRAECQALEENIAKLAEEIESQRQLRTDCLAASDPDAFEKALEETVRKAGDVLQTAERALQTAERSSIQAKTNEQNWQQALGDRRSAQDQTRAALANWLSQHHAEADLRLDAHDLEGLLALLAIAPEQWRPLREQLRQLDQNIRDQRTALSVVSQQLAVWQAQALSDRDEASVTELLAAASASVREALETTLKLKSDLSADDRRKQSAADQLDKIRRQQTTCEQWMKLDS
ncbi:MAG: AAA family ATPase, partial [Wenzhouxiangellaceae bacterium]|nr:AAA family ATPase [Wenzhouxiangellaceae bacterium]